MSLTRRRELLQRSASALLAAALAPAGRLARADAPDHRNVALDKLAAWRTDEGVLLSYDVRFDLPKDLEQALGKGIAVVFVTEAQLKQSRWYWTDRDVGEAVRRWRLAYQPLTRHWRLSLDGLSRHFNSLDDALNALRSADQWRIADPLPRDDDEGYYVDFRFRLATDELPRPLQIGLGGSSNWQVDVQQRVAVPPPR